MSENESIKGIKKKSLESEEVKTEEVKKPLTRFPHLAENPVNADRFWKTVIKSEAKSELRRSKSFNFIPNLYKLLPRNNKESQKKNSTGKLM